jgi:hypothetical protein
MDLSPSRPPESSTPKELVEEMTDGPLRQSIWPVKASGRRLRSS